MLTITKGLVSLTITLIFFTIFSLKLPKGDKAMSGLAEAAIASFLVEAVHKYIGGSLLNIKLLEIVGTSNGALAGVASSSLVAINMGANPIFALVGGLALMDIGILPGFLSGYIIGCLSPIIEKKFPDGLNIVLGALILSPLSRFIAIISSPIINNILTLVGGAVTEASSQSPLIMGFLLGGLMKIICTSPLSSMSMTAMLQLKGLPMGIASVASFGGAFTNGLVFKKMKIGDASNVLGVMLEPLTQADIIMKDPIPIFISDFIGGGLSGLIAAKFNIINNAPGTAAPIPGFLAPFAFNSTRTVFIVMFLAAIAGIIGALIGTKLIIYIRNKKIYKLREEH